MLRLFTNFEIVSGSENPIGDLIDGKDAAHGLTIYGNDGDDLVYGSAYSDTISDGYGDDTIYGMGGDDTFDQGSGGDTFDGGAGTDTLISNWSGSLPYGWDDSNYSVINLQEGMGIFLENLYLPTMCISL